MNEELSDRIWKSEAFWAQFADLNAAWLRKELAVGSTSGVSDNEVVRCIQAAVILSGNTNPDRQRAAYSIAACANDLMGEGLPGLAGALRVVLTRMGNFPAIKTVASVDSFHRLPTRVALSEEIRRGQNEVDAAGIPMKHVAKEL